jgi:hypothetical protein
MTRNTTPSGQDRTGHRTRLSFFLFFSRRRRQLSSEERADKKCRENAAEERRRKDFYTNKICNSFSTANSMHGKQVLTQLDDKHVIEK